MSVLDVQLVGAAVSLKTELVRAAVWFHGRCSDRAAGRRRDVFIWFFGVVCWRWPFVVGACNSTKKPLKVGILGNR